MNLSQIGFEVFYEQCWNDNGKSLPTLADLKSYLLENAANLAKSGSRRDLHEYMKLRQELRSE